MIVSSSIEAPLSYVDPTFTGGLDVAAKILDVTTGTAVVEATVPLIEYNSGLYKANYQFTEGKLYQIEKNVYTNNTYVTVDQDYPPSVDDIQCLNLTGGGGSTTSSCAVVGYVIKTPVVVGFVTNNNIIGYVTC